MTNCKNCKAPIHLTAYLSEADTYCSKQCLRRSPEFRARIYEQRTRPQRSATLVGVSEDVPRSPKKVGKLMKRRKSQRPPALRG